MKREEEDELLYRALRIAEQRMLYNDSPLLESPQAVRDFLLLWAAQQTEESFGAIWLTSKHQVIDVQILALGTIDGATVYPRALVRAGIAANAAAVILFHNHPSGNPEPSQADRTLTTKCKEALVLVDIRLLDHMIIGNSIISMAESGWI